MPYEKSDNTTNVVRPTLTKIQQAKKDTPQYRKYLKDKIEEEQLQRMSQDPYQAQFSQGRGRSSYDSAVQQQNEQRAKQMLIKERQAKAEEEAKVTLGAIFTPLLLSKWAGSVNDDDTHNFADLIANLYNPNNVGYAGITDKTRQWAKENPRENEVINLIGDIVGPGVLTRGIKLLPKVGFQQGGIRIGDYVYRSPDYANMGIVAPMPERIPIVPTPSKLKASKVSPTTKQNEIALANAPYGYDRQAMAVAAKEAFGPEIEVTRPLLLRELDQNQKLQKALDQVLSGTSEVKMAPGYRTLLEPDPYSILTATYDSLGKEVPMMYGTGLVSSKPISGLTPMANKIYRPSYNFGDMASLTDSLNGGLKYGFRDWDALTFHLNQLQLNKSQLDYATNLIERMKGFEEAVGFTTTGKTSDGLIKSWQKLDKTQKKIFQNKEAFDNATRQYLLDQEELGHVLAGDMTFGTKNQEMIFPAPSIKSMMHVESHDPSFSNIRGKAKDIITMTPGLIEYPRVLKKGTTNRPWTNILDLENNLATINKDSELQAVLKKVLEQPELKFPLHLRSVGPNPKPDMTTLGVDWAKPTFKKGGKIKK